MTIAKARLRLRVQYGDGAQITPFGLQVLKAFRAMESNAMAAAAKEMPAFSKLLRKTPPAGKIY